MNENIPLHNIYSRVCEIIARKKKNGIQQNEFD